MQEKNRIGGIAVKRALAIGSVLMILLSHAIMGSGSDEEKHPVQFALGGGISYLIDDHIDYKIAAPESDTEGGNRLYVVNDSRTRPELLAGVLVRLKGRLHSSLNLTITEGGPRSIDGVFMGLGWKIGGAVFVAGYSRHFGRELSPGFRRESNNRELDYDGYPIRKSGFVGDPVIDSYNSKWTFGILIPLADWPKKPKEKNTD